MYPSLPYGIGRTTAQTVTDLKLVEAVDGILAEIDGGRLAATEAISRLQAAMRSSRLPVVKTLESFDFSFQPSITSLLLPVAAAAVCP